MSEERAILEWQKLLDSKQTIAKYRNALAGNGGGTVNVAGEPGYIWCRYSADQSKVSKVFNIIAPGIPEDFPIVVGRRFPTDEFEQVLAVNWTLYQDVISQDTVDNFTTGNHGESHNAASGADPAPIDLRNIVEMRGRAQATPDLTVHVERGQYVFGYADVHRFPGANINLAASVPGVAGHRFTLVFVDGASNTLDSDDGLIVPLAAAAPIPDLSANTIPVCLVDLENGQTTITEDDIYDWRFLWDLVSWNAPWIIGTNAERLLLVVGDLAELTHFAETDTDQVWQVWEGAWRIVYPPAALAASDGDPGTPWLVGATGVLTGSQNLVLDDGASDSPQIRLVGGTNDDTAVIFLDDSGVATQSDLQINLPGTDANSVLKIYDGAPAIKYVIDAEGSTTQYVSDAITNTYSTWQTMEHATSGAAAAGFAGRILYRLEDAGGAMEDAASMLVEWENPAAAAEGTIIRYYIRKAGVALGEFVHFGATDNVFNEGGADVDTRIEAVGVPNALWVRGSDGRVGIGEATPLAALHVTTAGGVAVYQRSNAAAPVFNSFYNPDTTDGNGVRLGFATDTDGAGAAANVTIAHIQAVFDEHDNATYQSSLLFRVSDGGAIATMLTLEPDGDLIPGTAKGQDLGSAAAEWDNIYYVTANTGTSRLVDSTRICPVCGAQMKRGTGTVNVQGEDADYALVFCIACGVAGVEEWKHLPSERLTERRPPPMVIFEGMRVKSHGRSRTVSVDFRYGEDNEDERAIRNTTVLSDAELDDYINMTDSQRETFLLQLGRREWDAREEQRIMRDERDKLQAQLDRLTPKGIDLLKRGHDI